MNGSPNREKIIQRYRSGQTAALILQIVLVIASIALLPLLDWPMLIKEWFFYLPLVALVPLFYVPSLIQTMATRKKEIDNFPELSLFGTLDKHSLRQLVNGVLKDLQIPRRRVNVFVTSSPDIKASVVMIGLSRFLFPLRGIFLNRRTLHVLSPNELKSQVGHELGHLFPYALRIDKAVLTQLVAGIVLSSLLLQKTGPLNGVGYMIVGLISWSFLYISSLSRVRHARAAIYLCDEFATKAAGFEATITQLLKVGAAQEAEQELKMHLLRAARDNTTVTEDEALKVYVTALGFAPVDIEQTLKRVAAVTREAKTSPEAMSATSFIEFMWQESSKEDEQIEQREQQLRVHEMLLDFPLLDWQKVTKWNGKDSLSTLQIDQLIQEFDKDPDVTLFRVPGEFPTEDTLAHPSLCKRILYLWKNKSAIELTKTYGI